MIPARFTVEAPGGAPQNEKSTCSACKLPYTAHSGRLCACCRAPVEHHDAELPGPTEMLRFADCLAGQKRVANARQQAGAELTPLDWAVLSS